MMTCRLTEYFCSMVFREALDNIMVSRKENFRLQLSSHGSIRKYRGRGSFL